MSINLNLKIQKKDLWLLSAIVVFLVGVAYVIAYNAAWETSPGNPAVMGHTPDEIIVKNSSGSLISLQTLIDQGGFGGGSCGFGELQTLSSNSGQALEDGFILVTSTQRGVNLDGKIGRTSADTIVQQIYNIGYDYIDWLRPSLMFPVPKDYYWEAAFGGNPSNLNVYWIPLNCGGASGSDINCVHVESPAGAQGYYEINLIKNGINICETPYGCELFMYKTSDATGDLTDMDGDSNNRYIQDTDGDYREDFASETGGVNGDVSEAEIRDWGSDCKIYDDSSASFPASKDNLILRDVDGNEKCIINLCRIGA